MLYAKIDGSCDTAARQSSRSMTCSSGWWNVCWSRRQDAEVAGDAAMRLQQAGGVGAVLRF